jgi:hypothetical protein
LLLSAHVELETAIDFLSTGERIGYLLKSRIMKVEDPVDALERIALGGAVIEPVLVQELLAQQRRTDPLAALSAHEREVLSLVAEGRSNNGIAHRLFTRRLMSQKVIMTMRLRIPEVSAVRPPQRNNRHISCASEHKRQPGLVLLR